MKKTNFITHKNLRKEWLKDPKFLREFEKLETEFQIAKQIIGARIKQKMSQKQLARKVGTGQAVISRLETMSAKPSITLLSKVARALRIKMEITIQ